MATTQAGGSDPIHEQLTHVGAHERLRSGLEFEAIHPGAFSWDAADA